MQQGELLARVSALEVGLSKVRPRPHHLLLSGGGRRSDREHRGPRGSCWHPCARLCVPSSSAESSELHVVARPGGERLRVVAGAANAVGGGGGGAGGEAQQRGGAQCVGGCHRRPSQAAYGEGDAGAAATSDGQAEGAGHPGSPATCRRTSSGVGELPLLVGGFAFSHHLPRWLARRRSLLCVLPHSLLPHRSHNCCSLYQSQPATHAGGLARAPVWVCI
jgi:hypothetical protein